MSRLSISVFCGTRSGSALGDPAYRLLTDFNGSGGVGIPDIAPLRNNLGNSLPVEDPALPVFPGSRSEALLALLMDDSRRGFPDRERNLMIPVEDPVDILFAQPNALDQLMEV